MVEITESNHAQILNYSLKKLHNEARLTGKLESTDLYLLNVIYDLLLGETISLTNTQRLQLRCLYFMLFNNSKYICKVKDLKGYVDTFTTKFIVQEIGDANQIPVISTVAYWQEPLGVDASEILALIETGTYLDDKPKKTKDLFEEGVDIVYDDIGLIVFALNCSTSTTQYAIYDMLNNDVTSGFQSYFNEDLGLRIFISINIYSFGTINIKIKQL